MKFEVKGIGHYYKTNNDISFYGSSSENQWILKNISFNLDSAQSLGIIGPNGGGKSTLLKIIAGLTNPCEGKVVREGIKTISYLPQESSLNTLLPLSVYDILDFSLMKSKLDKKTKEEKILEAIKKVELSDYSKSPYSSLSGGQKQRVFLAKLFLEAPDLLILDEPTKGLDGQGQDILLKTIEELKKKHNTIVIIVDHNINQIIKHCDKVLCLNKTTHWHDKKELLNPKIIEHIYHCELEHLLIHESEGFSGATHKHEHCDHDHAEDKKHGSHN